MFKFAIGPVAVLIERDFVATGFGNRLMSWSRVNGFVIEATPTGRSRDWFW